MKYNTKAVVLSGLATLCINVSEANCLIQPRVPNVPLYETIYDTNNPTRDVVDEDKRIKAEVAMREYNTTIDGWYYTLVQGINIGDIQCSEQMLLTWAERKDFLEPRALWFISENMLQQAQNETMWKLTGVMATYAFYIRPKISQDSDRIITAYLNDVFEYYLSNVNRRWSVKNGWENNIYTWSRLAFAIRAYMNNDINYSITIKRDLDKLYGFAKPRGMYMTFPLEDYRATRAARYHQLNALGLFWLEVVYYHMTHKIYQHDRIGPVFHTAHQIMYNAQMRDQTWGQQQTWIKGKCNPQYAMSWILNNNINRDTGCINSHTFGNMGFLKRTGFISEDVVEYINNEVEQYATRNNN